MNCSEIRATAEWFGQTALRVCLVYEQKFAWRHVLLFQQTLAAMTVDVVLQQHIALAHHVQHIPTAAARNTQLHFSW